MIPSKTAQKRILDRQRRKEEAAEDRANVAEDRKVSDALAAYISNGSRPNRPAPTPHEPATADVADEGKGAADEGKGTEAAAEGKDASQADGKGKGAGWKANA